MRTMSVSGARAHFPRLLGAAAQGETIMLTKHGVPVAQLVPLPRSARDTAPTIQAILEFRQGITLGDVTLRELIEEGR